jgi:septin 3/9/12
MVNNDHCWTPILAYIREQYSCMSLHILTLAFLRKELTPQRARKIPDTRIHAILFFIAPTGHALSPLDIAVMKKLSECANVIPVIGKSDSLTLEEKAAFKKRIKEEIEYHGIRVYPGIEDEDEGREEKAANALVREMIPFAVVGSELNIVVDGKSVRGRKTRAGVVNVEDESHCEFVPLRNFLIRSHMNDLIQSTNEVHYEGFRTKQLLALQSNSSRPGSGVGLN